MGKGSAAAPILLLLLLVVLANSLAVLPVQSARAGRKLDDGEPAQELLHTSTTPAGFQTKAHGCFQAAARAILGLSCPEPVNCYSRGTECFISRECCSGLCKYVSTPRDGYCT